MSHGLSPRASTQPCHRSALWLFPVCIVFALYPPVRAAAASAAEHVELQLTGPSDCSDAKRVLSAIDAQLGAALSTDTQLRARAQITRRAATDYELLLDYTTRSGSSDRRVIRGESCETVSDAAALVLALALNPELALPPTAATEAAPAEAAPTASDAEGTDATPLTIEAALLGAIDSAVAAGPTLGAGLRLGAAVGALHLMLSAQGFLPRGVARSGVRTELQLWSLDLGACYLAPVGARLALGPCGRFEIGQLTGQSHGNVEGATRGSARLQALTVAGEVRLRLWNPLWLALNVGIEWLSRRPDFQVTGLGTIASPTTFGARIALGPLFGF